MDRFRPMEIHISSVIESGIYSIRFFLAFIYDDDILIRLMYYVLAKSIQKERKYES